MPKEELPFASLEMAGAIGSLLLFFYLWYAITGKIGYRGWCRGLVIVSQILPLVNILGLVYMALMPWPAREASTPALPAAANDDLAASPDEEAKPHAE